MGKKIQPMKVEAEFFVRRLLLPVALEGGEGSEQAIKDLCDLALVGLRVVVERGDGGQVYFEQGKDYPE